MEYTQLIDASGTDEIIVTGQRSTTGLWTNISKVNLLRSATVEFKEQESFEITKTGTIKWLITPPVRGTLLTLHAAFYPVWIALEHVYSVRDTLVSKKTKTTDLAEQHARLPLQSVVKLDFLVDAND
jgi:hypothetical protein